MNSLKSSEQLKQQRDRMQPADGRAGLVGVGEQTAPMKFGDLLDRAIVHPTESFLNRPFARGNFVAVIGTAMSEVA